LEDTAGLPDAPPSVMNKKEDVEAEEKADDISNEKLDRRKCLI